MHFLLDCGYVAVSDLIGLCSSAFDDLLHERSVALGLPPSLTIDPVNRQALFTAIFFLDLTMERLRYRAS